MLHLTVCSETQIFQFYWFVRGFRVVQWLWSSARGLWSRWFKSKSDTFFKWLRGWLSARGLCSRWLKSKSDTFLKWLRGDFPPTLQLRIVFFCVRGT
jgi:hypothetical protein